MDDVHSVVRRLGLDVEVPIGQVVYGTSSQEIHLSEYLLTAAVAAYFQQEAIFFTYENGRSTEESKSQSRKISPSSDLSQVEMIARLNEWLGVEVVLSSLRDIVQEMGFWEVRVGDFVSRLSQLRRGQFLVLHFPNRVYYNRSKLQKIAGMTIADVHDQGGWLAGSAIHYVLREWGENRGITFLAPWSDKGLVYSFYKGTANHFLLTPYLLLCPPIPDPWWLTFHIGSFVSLLEQWPGNVKDMVKRKILSIVQKPPAFVQYTVTRNGLSNAVYRIKS